MVFTIRRSAAAMEDIADNEAHGRWDGQDAEVYQGLFHLRMMTSRLAELLEVAQEQVEQCGNWEKVTLKEWEQTLDAVTETLVWLSEVEGGEILLPRKGRQRGLKETEELETMVREIGIQDQVTTLEELNGVLSKMAVSG